MADNGDERLIKPISERQFELYALSLERGPNFDPAHIFAAYKVGRGSACGCILLDPERGAFTTLALRRRIDHCWVRIGEAGPFSTPEAALDRLSIGMRGGDPRSHFRLACAGAGGCWRSVRAGFRPSSNFSPAR